MKSSRADTLRMLSTRLKATEASIAAAVRDNVDTAGLEAIEKKREALARIRARLAAQRLGNLVVVTGCTVLLLGALLHFASLPSPRLSIEAEVTALRVGIPSSEQEVMSFQPVQKFRLNRDASQGPGMIQELRLYKDTTLDATSTEDECARLKLVSGGGYVGFKAADGSVKGTQLGNGDELEMCDKMKRRIIVRDLRSLALGESSDTSGRQFAPSIRSGRLVYQDLGKQYELSPATVVQIRDPHSATLVVTFGKGLGMSLVATGGGGWFVGPAPRARFAPSLLEWMYSSPDLKALAAALSGLVGVAWKLKEKLAS